MTSTHDLSCPHASVTGFQVNALSQPWDVSLLKLSVIHDNNFIIWFIILSFKVVQVSEG